MHKTDSRILTGLMVTCDAKAPLSDCPSGRLVVPLRLASRLRSTAHPNEQIGASAKRTTINPGGGELLGNASDIDVGPTYRES